jgi:hypothetical protein
MLRRAKGYQGRPRARRFKLTRYHDTPQNKPRRIHGDDESEHDKDSDEDHDMEDEDEEDRDYLD